MRDEQQCQAEFIAHVAQETATCDLIDMSSAMGSSQISSWPQDQRCDPHSGPGRPRLMR
jgi:hypothetical protein